MRKAFIIGLLFTGLTTGWSQEIPDSIMNRLKGADDSTKVQILFDLARSYMSINLQQSIEFSTRALEIATSLNNLKLQRNVLTILGASYFYEGNFDSAKIAWLEGIEVLKQLEEMHADDSIRVAEYRNNRAMFLNNIGVVHKNAGEYDKAIEYYQQNLRIQEQLGIPLQMANSRANIGNVYYFFGLDYNKALENYNTALVLFRQHSENYKDIDEEDYNVGRDGMARIYLNIGMVYKELNDLGLANDNFRRSLNLFTELDNKQGIANAQSQIGLVYLEGGSYQEALDATMNALNVNREIGRRKETAEALGNIGDIYYEWGRFQEALNSYNQSLEMHKELNLKKEVYDKYKKISDTYAAIGNYRLALENYEMYNALKDSSIREENLNQISELETKYETERVNRENELLNTQNMLQETELKRQRVMIYSLIGIFVVILGSAFLLFRAYRAIKQANYLLEEQNIEIKHQRDQIFQQKQEITDSIHYASRIQTAILPPEDFLDKLNDHFILYKPRDIVSGDYYWMTQKNNKTIVVAADCTGHGVPGAFMSMLGISFLNEIVNKGDSTLPNVILNNLRDNVVNSLHQTGQEGEQQDGMDLALCVIDNDKTKLWYAGAYNPLYLVRDNELTEIKPDKMPIGIHKEKSDSFTNNEIPIRVGDVFYMFSDGYVDQFGGPKAKKFMTKNFKDLLISIHHKSMKEQREILDDTIEEWKGEVEQIDDILVMGLRI
jgi:serine phosphatase RsbU (regulator of sigma subunit)